MELRRRHIIAAKIIKPIIRVFCRFKYNVHAFKTQCNSKPPYIIISNHNCDLDPFFISFCFPFPIFFVASDHIFRWGLISKIIRYLVSPIPKLKSTSDIHTIRDIISSLHSGASVCIFPEGNRSWSGQTEEISPAIGKLIHHLSVPLVICRIRGAYLTTPRWGDKMRHGRIECRVVRELSPEDIDSLGVGELNKIIRNDLYVNAVADQEKLQVHYRGKNLAQSIETVLYTCPNCGSFATIRSKGDSAYCNCGLKFSYDSLGILHGAPFTTILEWDRWQTENLRNFLLKRGDLETEAPIFSDDEQLLYSFERAKNTKLIQAGRFHMYKDRFSFEGEGKKFEFYFRDILNVEIWGKLVLQFSLSDGHHYEVKSNHPRSAYKYLQAYKIIKNSN